MEEEEILKVGGKLTGSAVGKQRVAASWAVGAACERFSQTKGDVVWRSFRCVGLSFRIDGTVDHEISIKGIETPFLSQGLVSGLNEEGHTLEENVNSLVGGCNESVVEDVDDFNGDEDIFFA